MDPGSATGWRAAEGIDDGRNGVFVDGMARFAEVDSGMRGANNGLGPRFNSNQCLSCHLQPEEGGSSPAENPLIAVGNFELLAWHVRILSEFARRYVNPSLNTAIEVEPILLRQFDISMCRPLRSAFQAGQISTAVLGKSKPIAGAENQVARRLPWA